MKRRLKLAGKIADSVLSLGAALVFWATGTYGIFFERSYVGFGVALLLLYAAPRVLDR